MCYLHNKWKTYVQRNEQIGKKGDKKGRENDDKGGKEKQMEAQRKRVNKGSPWKPPPPPGPAPRSAGHLWAGRWLSEQFPCLRTTTHTCQLHTCNLTPLRLSTAPWIPILFSQQLPTRDNPHINRLLCTLHLCYIVSLCFYLYSMTWSSAPLSVLTPATMTNLFCHPQPPRLDLFIWMPQDIPRHVWFLHRVRRSCEQDT